MITDFGKKRLGNDDFFVNTLSKESLKAYYSQIEKLKPLTKEEEKELFIKLSQTTDELDRKKIKDKIINHNLLFVVSVARTYAKKITSGDIGVEELICEGNIGLSEAIEQFKTDSDNKFISYAIWHIRKRILLFLNENLYVANISSNIMPKIKIINNLKAKMEKECGHELDYEYVINNSDIGTDRIKNSVLMAIKSSVVTKSSITEENDYLFKHNDFEVDSEEKESNEVLKKVIYSLNPISRVIICHYYGLYDYKQLTIKQMSEEYNMTTIRIKKIIEFAIRDLKKNEDLKDFFGC